MTRRRSGACRRKIPLSGPAAISRFFAAKFGKAGYKGYKAACTNEKIGLLLAKWQGDTNEHYLEAAIEEGYRQRGDD